MLNLLLLPNTCRFYFNSLNMENCNNTSFPIWEMVFDMCKSKIEYEVISGDKFGMDKDE